jgi:hypothetical protein
MSQVRQSWRRGIAQQAQGANCAQRSPPPGGRVYPSVWTGFPDGCLAQADIDQARTRPVGTQRSQVSDRSVVVNETRGKNSEFDH